MTEELNRRHNLATIPTINNNGESYIVPFDIYKEGYEAYDISNWFKGRVGDNGTPFGIRWYKHGQLMDVTGMRPFIEGQVGDYTIDDSDPDDPKINMDSEASNVHVVGEVNDCQEYGVAIYRLINQAMPQSGIFYGKIGVMGTQDDGTTVMSSVDVVFKVLAGHMNMLGARKFYVSELEKALAEFKEKSAELQKDFQDKMDSNEQDFNARMTSELQNLQDHVTSYLSQYEGAVKYNIASLDHLASVASSIDAELKAADVANKQDFDNLKKDIVTKLSQMQLTPTVVTNLQELSTKYPAGAIGVFVTADDGCIAYYNDGWKKGSKFAGSALTEKYQSILGKSNDVSEAVLSSINAQIVYSYHNSDSSSYADDNYLRFAKLPKGLSHWLLTITNKQNSNPKVAIGELQDDGTYIFKSKINLKKGTGEPQTNEFDYHVINDNSYIFVAGEFAWTRDSALEGNFVQVNENVPFNEPTTPMVRPEDNQKLSLGLAGINATLIGSSSSKYPFYTNLDNQFLNDQTSLKNHYWNLVSFKKGEYLKKALISANDNNLVIEIREKIDDRYVLKKRCETTKFTDNKAEILLNYLAQNDGVLFICGNINYATDNHGELLEYDETMADLALALTPTENAHSFMIKGNVWIDHDSSNKLDKLNTITNFSINKIHDYLFKKGPIAIYDHIGDTSSVGVTETPNHYWNVLSFRKGDSLGTILIDSPKRSAIIEIREKNNDKYVLVKRVVAQSYSGNIMKADLNYHASNDGILFLSGSLLYGAPEQNAGPLYEYDSTDSALVLLPTSDSHAFTWKVSIYDNDDRSLFDTQIDKRLAVNNENNENIEDEKTNQKLGIYLNSLPKLIPSQGKYSLLGRWYTKLIDGKKYHVTNNNGAQIDFSIVGATYFMIDWKPMYQPDYARWAYSIDGNNFTSISTSQQRIDLPDAEKHVIQIVTDAIFQDLGKWETGNGFAFSDITTDGTMTALKPINPMIMYFGDSITEGIRTLGMDEKGPGCSVLRAYSWLSAKFLNAHPYLIGYGATGLSSKGSFQTNDYSIDWMTQGIAEKQLNPNLIIVNIGTNDSGVPDDQYDDLYKSFIHKLLIKYPGTLIGCMTPFNQTHKGVIKKIATETIDCFWIDTSDWNIATTDGTHPNVVGSQNAGIKLAKEIVNCIGNSWRSYDNCNQGG